jgi:dGTP triphosphohydrolase
MLTTIFDFEQRELSSRRQNQWGVVLDKDPLAVRELHHFIEKMYGKRDRPSLSQIVIDHMSLMTDRYARNFFQEIFLPKPVG